MSVLYREVCRPRTAGGEFVMRFIRLAVAQINPGQDANTQKQKIYDKIDYLI
jgi:hypothetical protein